MKIHVNNLILEVTRKCNMCCEHCLRGDMQNLDMDKKIVDEVLDKVDSISQITFTGGEPTLNLELMEYFFKESEKRGKLPSSFWLATNGKKNQMKLATLLLTYFGKMDEPELCGVALSVDAFHEAPTSDYLKGLSFYDTSKQHKPNDQYKWLIGEGKALENGLSSEGGYQPEELYIETFVDGNKEDNYSIEQIYVNAKGNILAGCDLSYETQDEYSLGRIKDLDTMLKETYSDVA